MRVFKNFPFLLILLFSAYLSKAQHTPLNPISYRVFSPFMFNPAISGSKDYMSFNFIAGLEGKSRSQILTADMRLTKKATDYFTIPELTEYSNIGIGGSVFNDLNGLSRNTGISAICSYHFPLDKQNLSFLSFGASVKGVFNTLKPGPMTDSALNLDDKKTFFPNLDVGIYYYGTNFYAGFSLTNLLGNPLESDSLDVLNIPVSQQYFFYTGYKFLLYRPLNIVLEPSFLITTGNMSFNRITDNIEPIIKVYLQDFCLGTYFNDKDRTSFFFQYRFPRINVGAFFDLPKNSAYYKKEFIMEFTAGINLFNNNFRSTEHSRW